MGTLFPDADSTGQLQYLIEKIKPEIILLDYQATLVANFDECKA